MSKYKLIIFDCDGTLVDTETLINKAFSDVMAEMGFMEFTTEYCLENFTGLSYPTVFEKLKESHPNLPFKEIEEKFIDHANEMIPKELLSMPDAKELLESLNDFRTCVASNGEPQVVRYSLETTNLLDFFDEDSIYTYQDVVKGKPEPYLFLHAAKREGFKPDQCLVIEDSIVGVQAAKAANMDVIVLHPDNYEHKFNFTEDLKALKPLAIIKNLLEVKKYL